MLNVLQMNYLVHYLQKYQIYTQQFKSLLEKLCYSYMSVKQIKVVLECFTQVIKFTLPLRSIDSIFFVLRSIKSMHQW